MLPTQLFAFGFGYSAAALALRLSPRGVACSGTTRSEASAEALRRRGWGAFLWPGPDVVPLQGAAWLISVPPDEAGCPVFRSFGENAGRARWIGYLSTTGVYGDLAGRWAFEETPRNPLSREAANRAAAEDQWLSVGATIFRLPGIYGPGRSALERAREPGARRILKPDQVFSRIHVDDLACLLDLAMCGAPAHSIYNVCDDLPAPSDEPLAYAADLLGVSPLPTAPFEEAGLGPAARRFYSECKRVSNARAKAALGWRPAFPTYREGLAACLAAASI